MKTHSTQLRVDAKVSKAFVTGACGFIGRHMIALLKEKKYQISATDICDKPRDELFQDVEFFKSNLTDPSFSPALNDALVEADVVFHIAGLFDYGAEAFNLFNVNVTGTRNLFFRLNNLKAKPRVVVWGAAGVYGEFKHIKLPAEEHMPAKTNNPYLISKLKEEEIALALSRTMDIPVTIIRPAGVYGPGAKYGMGIPIIFIGKGKLPPFILGKGNNRAPLVHVRDIVGAAEFLSQKPKAVGEIYNITADCRYASGEITKHLAKLLNVPFIKIKLPRFIADTFVSWVIKKSKKLKIKPSLDSEFVNLTTLDAWISNEKLKKAGYKFVYPDSKEGLRETVAWYIREGWI